MHHRPARPARTDRKSTRLNSSHRGISYAVFCLKKKNARSAFSRRARKAEGLLSCRRRVSDSERIAKRAYAAPRNVFNGRYHLLFFFKEGAPTEISPLPQHAALPI